jgi:hypothetical protein
LLTILRFWIRAKDLILASISMSDRFAVLPPKGSRNIN